jgi:hypothetical protein
MYNIYFIIAIILFSIIIITITILSCMQLYIYYFTNKEDKIEIVQIKKVRFNLI